MNENKKTRDTSKKESAVLKGAVSVFTEKGFEAASMDKIAEVSGVSKRTVYNHFPSKEILFQAIVRNFIEQKEQIKPIQYSQSASLSSQLKNFAAAELYLINDPVRRGLSKLLTSTFLMNIEFGNNTRGLYETNKSFIVWLNAAKADNRLAFESADLAARIFYGLLEGCITWNALLTDGASLNNSEVLLDEIVSVFMNHYGVK